VFIPDGQSCYIATELAGGPWDEGAMHGGAPAALLAHELSQLPGEPDLMLARLTYELLRPAHIGPVKVSAAVVRPGRRVQWLEASLTDADGTEVVRARALRVRRTSARADAAAAPPPPGPDGIEAEHGRLVQRTLFAPDAIEIRFVSGRWREPGPATAWFSLRVPLIEGVEVTPLQLLAAAGDFGNGISAILPIDGYVFINPDLTLYLEREPQGQWVALEASTRVTPDGIGLAESTLYDTLGRVGRAVQALYVAAR
jgi:hypothetical protein